MKHRITLSDREIEILLDAMDMGEIKEKGGGMDERI